MYLASSITGVVLAGGRGRRMGGADKGLLPLHGRPLAAHVLAALRPQVRQVLISANRNEARYADLGAAVLRDTVPGFAGPLAGMLAALRQTKTDWVLFAPCDAPRLPADLARRLLASASPDTPAYACADGEAQYVCCLLHRSLAGALESALAEGNGAVWAFLAAYDAVAVDFPDWPTGPRNINTPAALHAS